MIRSGIIILFYIILTNIYIAQPSFDSLFYSIAPLDDTTQVKKLKDLCWENRSINSQLAIKFGSLALSKMEATSEYKYYSETHNYLGIIFGNMGRLDSAYSHYKLALNYAIKNNNLKQIAYSQNNIGDYYYKNALFSSALEKILQAYEIFEQIGDERGMAYTLNDIGEIYLKQNDCEKALEHFLKSGEIRLKRNDIRGYAKSLLNQAAVYAQKELYDVALDLYEKAELYSQKANYLKGKSWGLAGISDIYMKQGDLDKALENRFDALSIDLKIGNKYGELVNYNQIGSIYLSKGLYKEAEDYLFKALRESERTKSLDQQLESYDLIRQLYSKFGNYRAAYKYLDSYEALKASIFSHENANKISDLQTAFISERKDKENEILRKNIEYEQKANNYLIIISLLILGAVFLLVLKFRSEKKANKISKETNQKLNNLNAQKDKMFSIIGHDLKNPAGTIQNFLEVLVEDYDELEESDKKYFLNAAYESSQSLTKLLLDLLEWGRLSNEGIEVNLAELELNEIVSQSVELLSLSAEEKNIDIEQNIEHSIVYSDKNMIYSVLRNLVSNSIKFTPIGGKITISDYQDDEFHYISTKDNGIGIEASKIDDLFRIDKVTTTRGTADESGTGLGLLVANEFVKKCGGEILVKSESQKGSDFIVKLPKKEILHN